MSPTWILTRDAGTLLAGGVVTLLAGVVTLRRRAVSGSPWFGAFVFATALWSLAGALELCATPLDLKLFLVKVQLAGTTSAFGFLAMAGREHFRLGARHRRAAAVLPWLVPAAVYALILTNERHHLFWRNVVLDSSSGTPVPVFDRGPAFFAWVAYVYVLLAVAVALLASTAIRRRDVYRKQALILLFATPWAIGANLLYLAGVTRADWTPAGFTLMALFVLWGIWRLRLFQLIPVAHERIVESMDEAVLVIDPLDRILTMNPAAHALLEMAGSPEARRPIARAIGRPAAEVFAVWPGLARELLEPGDRQSELSWSRGEPVRDFELRITSITPENRPAGVRLVILHDITRLKRAEAAALRQRAFAEALREIGTVIASTLERDKVRGLVLDQLRRVVSFDYAAYFVAEGPALVPVAAWGFPESHLFLGRRIPREECRRCGPVVDDGIPSLQPDVEDPGGFPLPFPRGPVRSFLGVPVGAKEGVSGMVALYSLTPGQFGDEDRRLASIFADQVAVALENARLYERMTDQAATDGLTGLLNRTSFFARAAEEYERARRNKRSLSALLIDIDHFKKMNDRHGHLAGDAVLRAVAAEVRSGVRPYDLLGRYGGEEFVLLMAETDLPTARILAERLRGRIEGLKVPAGERTLSVTVSVGAATLTHRPGQSLETLVKAADDNMYKAKAKGRNLVYG